MEEAGIRVEEAVLALRRGGCHAVEEAWCESRGIGVEEAGVKVDEEVESTSRYGGGRTVEEVRGRS